MLRGNRQGGPGVVLGFGGISVFLSFAACGSTDPGVRYCAVNQTISCYGNPGVSESICDEDCTLMPGSSSYDEETGCLIEVGPEHGAGSSCEQALDDLIRNSTCAPSEDDEPCTACAKESCCRSYDACMNDDECITLFYCVAFCTSDGCPEGCYAAHPTVRGTLDTYLTCLDSSCAEACAE